MIAEIVALLATAIAAVSSIPQLRRIVVAADTNGVSLSFATIGLTTELTWGAYALSGGLWSAVPEAVLMVGANAVMAAALVRTGIEARRSVAAAGVWLILIIGVAGTAGADGIAVVLAAGYAVQVAPSVWTAYRTPDPSGVAAATWALVGVEAVLWGSYGVAHGDPATIGFGVVGSLATMAILARKRATRNAVPRSSPAVAAPPSRRHPGRRDPGAFSR